jgi:hypothetical protein
MIFESLSPEEGLKADIKATMITLVEEKLYGKFKLSEEKMIVQLDYLKGHINELADLVGEEDETVVELKNRFNTNFASFGPEYSF